MANPTTTVQQKSATIMPPVSGPDVPNPAPMLGQNVQVAQPATIKPTTTPEAVMLQAMMRRVNRPV